MNADFYRLKKGRALFVTIIVSIALVVFIAVMSASTSTVMESLPTDGMSASEIAELQQDMAESQALIDQTINTASNFTREIIGQNMFFFVFLSIILAVFCADFNEETYKNTLSYESNRGKIYFSKLFLAIGISLGLKLIMILTSLLFGILFIGGRGLDINFFIELAITFLKQLPIYVATISATFLIISIVKKSSATIGLYVGGLFGITLITQSLPSINKNLEIVQLLDPLQATTLLAQPGALDSFHTTFILATFAIAFVLFTLLGVNHFKKCDLN